MAPNRNHENQNTHVVHGRSINRKLYTKSIKQNRKTEKKLKKNTI